MAQSNSTEAAHDFSRAASAIHNAVIYSMSPRVARAPYPEMRIYAWVSAVKPVMPFYTIGTPVPVVCGGNYPIGKRSIK